MHSAYNVGYEEYSHSLDKRLSVEKQREQNYKEEKRLLNNLNKVIE